MSEKNSEQKRLKGFAGVMAKQLEPVNNVQRFKERFKDYDDFKLLINANDGKYAALIKINRGNLTVEEIKNDDKATMKKLKKECDGFLEMTTDLFFKLAMGKLSNAAFAKKWLTRKIKMKGMKNVMILTKIFYYLSDQANKE
jgi:hypothetical protein